MAKITAGDDGESFEASVACEGERGHERASHVHLCMKAKQFRKGTPIRICLERQEALQLNADLAAALAKYEPYEPISGGRVLG